MMAKASLAVSVKNVQGGPAGDHAVDAVVLHRDGAVHDEDELALVLLDRGGARRFCLVARRCAERFVVIEGDKIEDQVFKGGMGGPKQRFTATGAFLCGKPNDRRALCRAGDCLGYLLAGTERQPHACGHDTAILQELSA